MDKDLAKEVVEQRTISKLEEDALIKYEKKSKPYRQEYRAIPQPIVCEKCGNPYNLMKTTLNGHDFYFCRRCVMERARELSEGNIKK